MTKFEKYMWADIDDMLSALQPSIKNIGHFQESVVAEIDRQVGKDCEDCPNKKCKYYEICNNESFDKVDSKNLKELLSALIKKRFTCEYAENNYYCYDCEEFFGEADTETDDLSPNGMSMVSGHYTYEKCPCCSSDNIEEV